MKTKTLLRKLPKPLSHLALKIELDHEGWVQSCYFLREKNVKTESLKTFRASELSFALEKVHALTPFQKKVYKALVKVSEGKTVTYKTLAQKAKVGQAYRAVGTAMRTNPLVLYVPCHRVLKSDGGLGNYSGTGGVKTKEALLRLERAL